MNKEQRNDFYRWLENSKNLIDKGAVSKENEAMLIKNLNTLEFKEQHNFIMRVSQTSISQIDFWASVIYHLPERLHELLKDLIITQQSNKPLMLWACQKLLSQNETVRKAFYETNFSHLLDTQILRVRFKHYIKIPPSYHYNVLTKINDYLLTNEDLEYSEMFSMLHKDSKAILSASSYRALISPQIIMACSPTAVLKHWEKLEIETHPELEYLLAAKFVNTHIL